MVFTIVGVILLSVVKFSWWDFLLIPAGLLVAILYTTYAAQKWRMWAYGHVAGIHQLQRSAELAGILTRQTYDQIPFFLSCAQKNTLKVLQKRFSDEPAFVDDYSIPPETKVFSKSLFGSSDTPVLTISESSIDIHPLEVFEWEQITNERISRTTYSKDWGTVDGIAPSGSRDFFRFEYVTQHFETFMSTLDIAVWKLDLLLYIYRGRFEAKRAAVG